MNPTLGERLAIVADDDPEMRSLVATVLRGLSLHVVEVESGRELLERASALPATSLALVVTDLQMPGLTGLRALRQMRRIGVHVPVILITAFGNPRVHDEAVRSGASLVLDKPFSLVAFRDRAADLLADTARQSGVHATRRSEHDDPRRVG